MRLIAILSLLFIVLGCESQPQQEPDTKPAQVVDDGKPKPGDKIRPMAVAGQFYPAGESELRKAVEGYMAKAGEIKVQGRPVALFAPHAGYKWSGPVAGYAYAAVKGKSYDTVVVIGGHMPGEGVSVLDVDYYQTPLGYVKVDKEVVKELLELSYFDYAPARHVKEWAMETQVPFLQVALKKGFRIVSLAVNDSSCDFAHKIAYDLAHALEGKNVLIIGSTDLTHYPPYKVSKEIDAKMTESWKTLDVKKILEREEELSGEYADALRRGDDEGCAMCGRAPVAIAVELAKLLDADSIDVLNVANSGDAKPENRDWVVGYGSAAVYEKLAPGEVSGCARRFLLKVAREAITAVVTGGKEPQVRANNDELEAKRGIFVTLMKNGDLRGCVGCFFSEEELPQTIATYALMAATRDNRFNPVQAKELSQIKIKISILSAPWKAKSVDEVVVGKHGIWVRDPKTGMGGTYLPEVATEQGWNREKFLSHCCGEKAGLPADAWKTGKADIYIYTTQVFGEK
jgi:AmmeMemoRadiSam system protein B/AmmeMemoRadiSam system protein A